MNMFEPTGEKQTTDHRAESLSERLESFYTQTGFYPHTNRELSLANGAISSSSRPGKFAHYLNDVLLHQMKSSSKRPESAVDTIVKEVRGFSRSAEADRSFIREIWDDLEDAQPTDTLDIFFRDDWKLQSSTMRGLTDLTRRIQISHLLPSDKDKKIEDLVNEERIETTLVGVTGLEAKRYLNDLLAEEVEREDFWNEHLRAARLHMVANHALRSSSY